MSISSINYSSSVLGAQIRNINQKLTDLSTQLSTGKLSQNYSGMGTNEGFAIASRAQLSEHRRLYRHHHQRQCQHQPRQHRVAGADDHSQHGADRRRQHRAGSQRQRTDDRAEHRCRPVRLDDRRASTRRRATAICFSGTAFNTPVGRQRQRHHQRYHHAGRLQDRDGGASGRRSRRQRHGTPGAVATNPDLGLRWRRTARHRRSA